MSFKALSVRMLITVVLILLSSFETFGTPYCEKKERASTYLDAAVDLITKAKSENISCPEEHSIAKCTPQDCTDLYRSGINESGVYTIWPANRLTSRKSVHVYCDMDNGGWTVIQRRGDFKRQNDYFNQNWESYKKGFGDLEEDFWLGNDNIFAITNQRQYAVYFDLQDKRKNKGYAQYDNFWIDDEFHKYTLHISGYRGTAGDAMTHHDTMKFSTKDRDNDNWRDGNCAASEWGKGGWWFNECAKANLNGIYKNENRGNFWHSFTKSDEYLPRTEIKIKSSIY